MRKKEKMCVLLLKYISIISAFLMLMHIITLILGITICLSELAVLSLVSIMVIFWSHVFKFCLVHKLASLYTIMTLWCCYIQRFIGFGEYLEFLRISFLYFGIWLFIFIGFKYVRNYKESLIKNNK